MDMVTDLWLASWMYCDCEDDYAKKEVYIHL